MKMRAVFFTSVSYEASHPTICASLSEFCRHILEALLKEGIEMSILPQWSTEMRLTLANLFALSLFLSGIGLAEVPTTEFWRNAEGTVSGELLPATVKIASDPSKKAKFATFRLGDEFAPAEFVPVAAAKPFVDQSAKRYEVKQKALTTGAQPFSDRKYKISHLPPNFRNLTLLRTRMAHKSIVDSRFAIKLQAAQPCHVFVAIDERAIETYQKHGGAELAARILSYRAPHRD